MAPKKGNWDYAKEVRKAKKALATHHSLAAQREWFSEVLSRPSATPQNIARNLTDTIGAVRHLETLVRAQEKPAEAWPTLHLVWRYYAFVWFVYLERAEQLAQANPELAKNKKLPIGIIEFQWFNAILMVAAFSAVVGEDDAADWFAGRCVQMMQSPPPYVSSDAWNTGSVEQYLLRLYCRWRRQEIDLDAFGVTNLGPYARVFSSWNDPESLEVVTHELCELHAFKVANRDLPNDDLVFGLQDGFYAQFPIEILFLRRVRRDLSLSVPDPDHPLLRSPLIEMPFPCPKSGPEEYIGEALSKCREQMPSLAIPWEQSMA